MVYDPFTRKIYASIPSKAGSSGNTITPIEPQTGAIGSPVYVGSEPGKLAVSDDGRFIYVALDGAASVRQFDLVSQTAGLQFSLGTDPSWGLLYPSDLKVLPGNPEAVAVLRKGASSYSSTAGVSIHDNGVKRLKDALAQRSLEALETSDAASLLYAIGGGLHRITVDSSGTSLMDTTSFLIGSGSSSSPLGIQFSNGLIYATTGEVIDPGKRTLLRRFTGIPSNASMLADSSVGRTFFVGGTDSGGTKLAAFDQRTFTPAGTLNIYGIPASKLWNLIRWGTDGLAFRNTDQIFIVRTPLVAGSDTDSRTPVLSALSPASATAGGPNIALNLTGSNFTPYSIVRWNGSDRFTRFVSSTQLTAFIAARDIASSGSASVSVFNAAAQGSFSSESINLTICSAPGSPPAVNAGGIVHGAGFTPRMAIAGGSIVSLFGSNLAPIRESAGALPLPAVLGGVSVRVNGIAAPLSFVSPQQINFVLPWEALLEDRAAVMVTVGRAPCGAEMLDLAKSVPGIFTINQTGSGQGAIMIAGTTSFAAATGTLPQARPATAGEFISIYCSGLGDVTNRPANGAPAPSNPLAQTTTTPTVTIGGLPANINFSGLAPGFVGLYQVNAQVPTGIAPGGAVPVVITQAGMRSNAVTIAVR